MKTLIQAMRAVSVELLGVIFVLWMLFESVSWTLESAGAHQAAKHPTALRLVTGSADRSLQTSDVGERLDHYSRIYGRAATGYFRQVTENFTSDLPHRAPLQQHNEHGQPHTL